MLDAACKWSSCYGGGICGGSGWVALSELHERTCKYVVHSLAHPGHFVTLIMTETCGGRGLWMWCGNFCCSLVRVREGHRWASCHESHKFVGQTRSHIRKGRTSSGVVGVEALMFASTYNYTYICSQVFLYEHLLPRVLVRTFKSVHTCT